jgi:hypothetical protein
VVKLFSREETDQIPAGHHWPLLALFVFLCSVFAFGQCSVRPYYFEAALATATLTLILADNHIRAAKRGDLNNLRIFLVTLFDLLLIGLLSFFSSFLGSMTVHYDCVGSRSKVSEVVLYAHGYHSRIKELAEAGGSPADFVVEGRLAPGGRVTGAYVKSDGTIFAMSDDPPALYIRLPEPVNGDKKWRCFGVPEKYMPSTCRDDRDLLAPSELPPLQK